LGSRDFLGPASTGGPAAQSELDGSPGPCDARRSLRTGLPADFPTRAKPTATAGHPHGGRLAGRRFGVPTFAKLRARLGKPPRPLRRSVPPPLVPFPWAAPTSTAVSAGPPLPRLR